MMEQRSPGWRSRGTPSPSSGTPSWTPGAAASPSTRCEEPGKDTGDTEPISLPRQAAEGCSRGGPHATAHRPPGPDPRCHLSPPPRRAEPAPAELGRPRRRRRRALGRRGRAPPSPHAWPRLLVGPQPGSAPSFLGGPGSSPRPRGAVTLHGGFQSWSGRRSRRCRQGMEGRHLLRDAIARAMPSHVRWP